MPKKKKIEGKNLRERRKNVDYKKLSYGNDIDDDPMSESEEEVSKIKNPRDKDFSAPGFQKIRPYGLSDEVISEIYRSGIVPKRAASIVKNLSKDIINYIFDTHLKKRKKILELVAESPRISSSRIQQRIKRYKDKRRINDPPKEPVKPDSTANSAGPSTCDSMSNAASVSAPASSSVSTVYPVDAMGGVFHQNPDLSSFIIPDNSLATEIISVGAGSFSSLDSNYYIPSDSQARPSFSLTSSGESQDHQKQSVMADLQMHLEQPFQHFKFRKSSHDGKMPAVSNSNSSQVQQQQRQQLAFCGQQMQLHQQQQQQQPSQYQERQNVQQIFVTPEMIQQIAAQQQANPVGTQHNFALQMSTTAPINSIAQPAFPGVQLQQRQQQQQQPAPPSQQVRSSDIVPEVQLHEPAHNYLSFDYFGP